MPSDFPFMKLWVEDALNDMQEMGLDDEEFGAYWKLLLYAWKKQGVPADLKERARFVSASPQRLRKLEKAFGHKFTADGEDTLVNPKQELVREDARTKSKTASESAKARWEKVRRERADAEDRDAA